jgi:hypothetical protein
MKTRVIAAVVLTLAFAVPVFAADGGQPSNGSGPNFEQRKAEILDRLSNQAANLQQAKDCVQAAKNRDDLKACREKHMAAADGSRAGMRKQGGGPGSQQGQ